MSADHSGANADGIAIYGHDGISLYTAQTERLRIASNGLVGIGTTISQITSSERLSVSGAVTALRFDSTTTGSLYLRNGDFTVGTNNPYLVFQDTVGNRGGIGIANTESVMFIHGQNGIRFRYNGTSPGNKEAMRFDSNGRVSIGTDSGGTARAFRVKAPSQNSTHISLIDNDSTQEIWQVGNQSDGDGFMQLLTDEGTAAIKFDASGINYFNGGNLGIGTDNPGAKLTVWADDSVTDRDVFQVRSKTGAFNIQVSDSDAANPEWSLRTYANEPIVFKQATTERLRITSDGNVAINKTSSISAKLHIGDTSNDGALSQLVKLANDSSGSGTGAQLNLGAGNAVESTAACIGGFYDGTGASFIIKTAGTYANQSTVGERVRVDGGGRMLLGQQRNFGGGTYYDDLTINNSNTANGSAGGAGIDLVSGNNSWGGYIFSDSDNHARGYLKYDHGDDAMVFGTSGSNRIYLDSDGKLILSSTARETPFITGDGGMCIEQNYDGALRALTIRNKSTHAAAGTALAFSLNRTGGDQDFLAGEIKLIKDQNWTTTSSTVDGSMVFSTIYNGVLAEKLRISADGSLRVENSDYNDLIGCTGEHSGETNSLYKTNSKTNLTSGTWYTIAIAPTGRNFASFMIQDLASSRHTCFYFNAGHQYGGSHNQNCINVIGASGTHGTQVFGGIRIKAYGTYDGAMLQVYIQNGVSQVQAYMVGENLAPQRWRMRDWIADGTDPGGLSNWSSIQASGNGLSAYADLNRLTGGGASFSGHVLPGLDNTYSFGSSSRRWGTIYATSSSINTSDITLKRDISVLNDAEMRAAARISKKFKQYRWNDSYAEKGDDARYHSGVMAQTVRDEMLAEGLDPTRYGFYCVDTWYEDSEGTRISKFYPTGSLVDEDDPAFNTPDVGEPEIPANMSLVTGYSLRYEELLCFIAAYNEQRFASLESRLSALES